MKTFVLGDLHGAHKALLQCLERSGFDRQADRLIALGDICDGYPDVKACIDELRGLPRLELITGNHDLWALGWAREGLKPEMWLAEGGRNTIKAYGGKPMPAAHIEFLSAGRSYLEEAGRLFVHGGFDPERPLGEHSLKELAWDRSLVETAKNLALGGGGRIGAYQEIYVGHTPTLKFGTDQPLNLANLWMLDTGAGWSGRLTLMDVETKQFWQSDPVVQLYPRVKARG